MPLLSDLDQVVKKKIVKNTRISSPSDLWQKVRRGRALPPAAQETQKIAHFSRFDHLRRLLSLGYFGMGVEKKL